MIKLLISIFFIFIFSCKSIPEQNLSKIINDDTGKIKKNISNNNISNKKIPNENNSVKKENKSVFYFIGEPYFLEGVQYVPEENFDYNENGLASFYGKELHNKKTVNNDINKVTELLGRHKTLPLPSIAKITNLENGLSITIKIVDRHEDNYSIIQVSRKVAQLLRFYKNRIARVRVEILEDPSKQWKSVSLAMNEPNFNTTINSAPTDLVSISNLDENSLIENDNNYNEKPVEIGTEPIQSSSLFIKIYNFNSYEEIQKTIKDLELSVKYTSERDQSNFTLILGPLNNEDADKLVSSFIMKGYKETEILLE